MPRRCVLTFFLYVPPTLGNLHAFSSFLLDNRGRSHFVLVNIVACRWLEIGGAYLIFFQFSGVITLKKAKCKDTLLPSIISLLLVLFSSKGRRTILYPFFVLIFILFTFF